MKRWLLPLLSASCLLHAVDPSVQETLELRRIAEYWKEKEYVVAEQQIERFLRRHSDSPFCDQLNAMLGDLHFERKNFHGAVEAYQKIEESEFRLKSAFNLLHALYKLNRWEEVVELSSLVLHHPVLSADIINTAHFEVAEAYFHLGPSKENFESALSHYSHLTGTKYATLSLHPLAIIHAYLGDNRIAAPLYLSLAEKNVDKKEEFLFQAASLQLSFDRAAARETFMRIVDLGGRLAPESSFNLLTTLFQEKRYREFLLAQDKIAKWVVEEKRPMILYCKGKSYYHVEDYERAKEPLLSYAEGAVKDPECQRNALLTLISIARTNRDIPLFDRALLSLRSFFPAEEKIADSLLAHAELCREALLWQRAREDLQLLTRLFPNHPQKESLCYDAALFYSKEEKWAEACNAFEQFLVEFPKSEHAQAACRHLINCRIEDVKGASADVIRLKKEDLASALKRGLEEVNGSCLKEFEKQQMALLLGQTLYEIDAYDEALDRLTEYVQQYPKDPSCAEIYLLIASCYQKGIEDPLLFALNVEKALLTDPRLKGAEDLHLSLFNIYLRLSQEKDGEVKNEMIESAAEHLYLGLDASSNRENHLWLAHFLDEKCKTAPRKDRSFYAKRLIALFEKVLDVEKAFSHLHISPETIEKEAEVIKLATLYQKEGRTEDSASLLETLVSLQKSHADWPWKYHRMAAFELGKVYCVLSEVEKANALFDDLIFSSQQASSYFALAAELERAKLEFSHLPSDQREETAPQVQKIFDTLKTLQIRRKLLSEPLHLEAGLTYIDMKQQLTPAENQLKRKLFLLERLRESFSSPEDPLVHKYLLARESFPEQARVYDQYISFLSAQILLYEGLVAKESGEKERGQQLCHLAQTKFEILEQEFPDPKLLERLDQSKEAIRKSL